MMLKNVVLFCLLFTAVAVSVQAQESEFFQVTFDAFSPPTKDMIRAFEGSEPMPFLATDINGVEHYLKNYQGKVVFVYFWNGQCVDCLAQISSLNLLHREDSDKLQIISFADENKEDATILAQSNGVEFPVLSNGRLLGEAAYGIELGYPRLFAIDESGKVIQVLPQAALEGNTDIYLQLKNLLTKITRK